MQNNKVNSFLKQPKNRVHSKLLPKRRRRLLLRVMMWPPLMVNGLKTITQPVEIIRTIIPTMLVTNPETAEVHAMDVAFQTAVAGGAESHGKMTAMRPTVAQLVINEMAAKVAVSRRDEGLQIVPAEVALVVIVGNVGIVGIVVIAVIAVTVVNVANVVNVVIAVIVVVDQAVVVRVVREDQETKIGVTTSDRRMFTKQ